MFGRVEELLHALIYAMRSLRRTPGFVTVSTLSLGLALGLCTTTYAVFDAVTHPVVPFERPDELFRVVLWGSGVSESVTGYDKYVRLRDETSFYQDIALHQTRFTLLSSGSTTLNGSVTFITPNLMTMLGVAPVVGRGFGPGDSEAAIVSHHLWRRMFRNSSLADAALVIDGQSHPVIGVMPRGMSFPFGPDVWMLLAPTAEETGLGIPHAQPVVRLRPGVARESAQRELRPVAERLTEQFGTGPREFYYELRSIVPDPIGIKRSHVAMAGAALAVLLIACANLANLMLARGISYQRDYALRMALGASRGAVMRLVLAEGAVIAACGGIIGALLAVWGVDLLTNRMPPEVTHVGTLAAHLTWRVFLFGLLTTGAVTLVFALLPAVRVSSVDVSEPLKDSAGTTTTRSRAQYSLIAVAEIGLTMVLLLGASLLTKAAERVSAYDFGYDPRGLLLTLVRLPDEVEGASANRFFAGMLARVTAVEGIQRAATMESRPLEGGVVISDESSGAAGRPLYRTSYPIVSADFLRTLGIPIAVGRDFEPGDELSGAVILSRDAAADLFPYGAVVGRHVKLGDRESDAPWLPVVGVANNAALSFEADPDLPPVPAIYVLQQTGGLWRRIVARTSDSEAVAATRLQREIQTALSGRPVLVTPWLRFFDDAVNARRFMSGVFALFGVFALGLAAVGLYSVLAFAVGRRMREFAVRLALGATSRDVLKLVFHDGLVIVLAGTGVGAFLAMWMATGLHSWLYDVPPTDALSLVLAESVLILVSLAACLAPALKALRADPVEVLRAT